MCSLVFVSSCPSCVMFVLPNMMRHAGHQTLVNITCGVRKSYIFWCFVGACVCIRDMNNAVCFPLLLRTEKRTEKLTSKSAKTKKTRVKYLWRWNYCENRCKFLRFHGDSVKTYTYIYIFVNKGRLKNSIIRLVKVNIVRCDALPGLITLILHRQQHVTWILQAPASLKLWFCRVNQCFVFYLFVLIFLCFFGEIIEYLQYSKTTCCQTELKISYPGIILILGIVHQPTVSAKHWLNCIWCFTKFGSSVSMLGTSSWDLKVMGRGPHQK